MMGFSATEPKSSLRLLFFAADCGGAALCWSLGQRSSAQNLSASAGIALAILLSGSGLVSTVAPLLLASYVGTPDWQQGFFVMGILPLATLMVCFLALPAGNTNLSQCGDPSRDSATTGADEASKQGLGGELSRDAAYPPVLDDHHCTHFDCFRHCLDDYQYRPDVSSERLVAVRCNAGIQCVWFGTGRWAAGRRVSPRSILGSIHRVLRADAAFIWMHLVSCCAPRMWR